MRVEETQLNYSGLKLMMHIFQMNIMQRQGLERLVQAEKDV